MMIAPKELETKMRMARPRILCVDDEPQLLGALLPISMPGMNGVQFLAQARIISPESTRILLAGHPSIDGAIAAVNEGNIFRFLIKPCAPNDLRRCLEDALEQTRLVTQDRMLLERKLESISGHLVRAERLASLGTMAGAIGHELNNVLLAFMTTLECIHNEAASGKPPTAEDLETMTKIGGHLTTHAKNLLRLGGSGKADGAVGATDLGTAARDALAILQSAGILRHVQTKLELPAAPLIAAIGKTEIEQVLVNLVKNAAEATGAIERPSIEIALSASTDGHFAVCAVRDNGTGIAKDQAPFIFEPYFTTKPADRGTGLGLFVVRQILQQCAGVISVESAEQQGTTFTFKLPLVADSSQMHGQRVA
jgi:C4-dicarboxylate-specific signal transduction histidine kinase